MLSTVFNFDKLLQELEVMLCIDSHDYANRDVNSAFNNIKNKIQRTYAIDINSLTEHHLIDSPALEGNMSYAYANLAMYSHMFRYTNKVPINLSSINHFGMTKNSLKTALVYLQRKDITTTLATTMDKMQGYIKNVPMCIEKKLFMLLCVTYMLKYYEVSAVLAEILYLGDI